MDIGWRALLRGKLAVPMFQVPLVQRFSCPVWIEWMVLSSLFSGFFRFNLDTEGLHVENWEL